MQLVKTETYQVHLPQFEGPFDLLLFFIERDELNIHDIPIAKLTGDFLDYMRSAAHMPIEVASEFALVAAQLIKIKAVMLLPRPQIDANGEEVDPRAELVDRLLLYKQFREASNQMEMLEAEREQLATRGFIAKELEIVSQQTNPGDELIGLTLFHLAKAYERVLKRKQVTDLQPKHVIQRYPYSVEGVRDDILRNMKQWKKVDFNTFVAYNPDKLYVVFSLLVMLDLIQQQVLTAVVGEGFNNFWLVLKNPDAAADFAGPGPDAASVTVEIVE
jgi:segregation and condensation protein A